MKEDPIKVMKNSLNFLRIPYLFPKSEDIDNPKKNLYIRFCLLYLTTYYVPLGAAFHLAMTIKQGTYANIDRDVSAIISYHGASYFNFRCLISLKNMIKLYKEYSDFESYGIPTKFDKMNNLLNKISTLYFCYHTLIVTGMTTSTLLTIGKCEQENISRNISEVCGLVAATWLPFDYNYFPLKQFVYGYQLYSYFLIFQCAGLLSYTLMETIEHLIVRFEHVADVFVMAVAEKDPQLRRKKFNAAVKYHKAVIEMGELLNTCFSPGMVVHISLTGPVLGVAGYRFLTEIPLDSTCLFIGWMISTSVVCSGGQRLSDASTALGHVIYSVEWYNLETDLQRDLGIVMMRCQKPVMVSAGPFGTMTYATMMVILKTSYSYVTLLKQTM
uniref:Odorant receptor n=1 Tax=Chrysomela lapponica TaxID=153811 RepID=A0A310SA13_CHRLA